MKKIKYIAFLLAGTLASLAFAADVAPLSFSYISQADTQQAEWDYLMKYKLFGATGIRFKNQKIQIPDSSGWFGTAEGDFLMMGDGGPSNGDILVGGPILIGGDVSLDLGPDVFTSGPVRVTGNVDAPADGFKTRENRFVGPQCVQGTTDSKYEAFVPLANQHFGSNYGSCPPTVPEIRTRLRIPALTGSHTYQDAISVKENQIAYIDVPEGEGMYDIYIAKISAINDGRIYVRMPKGGRLTRIFLRDGIDLGQAHPKLQIQYKQDDGSYQTVSNKDYSGNLLFYTKENISFASFLSTDSIQGTFITTGQISIAHHLTLAGQLLANYILIDTDFDGSGFRYVPFDPPVLDLFPEAGTSLEFPENDVLVKVPIALDTPAPVNVYFDYCFDFDQSQADANDITPVEGYSFPICSQGQTAKVTILENSKTPADAPSVSVWIKVKKDYAVEGNETLRLVVKDLIGAVLPGNKHDGYFDLVLIDSDKEPTSKDFAITAIEDEIYTFESSEFYFHSAFEKVQKGILISELPSKGTLLHNGVALTSADLDRLVIPMNAETAIDLQFIGVQDGFGVDPVYTTFKFSVVDEDGIVSKDPYTVTVKVSPVNDAPTVSPATIVIGEVDHEVKSGAISASDIENDELTYKFDDAFDEDFTEENYNKVTSLYEMDPATGVISVISSATLNYESADKELTIKVKVIDNAATTNGAGKDSAFAVVTLKIEDQNEAPVITDKGPFYVDENSKNVEVGQVIAKDPDTENPNFGTLTYSIDETDVPFVIDPQTGVITVTADAELDFETKPEWVIHVTVTDGYESDNAEVVINIRDLNEKPVIVNLQDNYNEFEHVENGHVFATVKVVDQDGSDGVSTISAQIIDDNAGTPGVVTADQLFDVFIVEGTGDTLLFKFFVKDSALLDYEKLFKADTVRYDVTLSITDANGGDGSKTITATTTIYVTDVNETPTAENGEFTIKENSEADTFVGKVVASDPDFVNPGYGTLYYSLMTETPQFKINELTGEITVAAGAELDYETTPDHQISLAVAVTDRVIAEPLIVTVIVHLTDENEKPVLTCKPDDDCRGPFDAIENSAKDSVIYEFAVFDVDAGDRGVLETFIVDSLHRGADTLFTTRFNDDSTLVQLIVKKGTNLNYEKLDETYLIVITVKDDDGLNDTLIREVNIVDVNEAPVVADADFNVKENSTSPAFVGQVEADDEDKWAVLHYTLENIPGEGDVVSLFEIDELTGKITVAANAVLDYETKSEYKLKVVVTDNGSDKGFEDMSDEAIVTIHVTDEDEKPGFDDKNPTPRVSENSKKNTPVGTVTAKDDDCNDGDCATLTYKLIADTTSVYADDYKEFQIDPATGAITVANDSTLNYEVKDVYKVWVVVYDGAAGAAGTLTDTAFVTINILDANDRPEIASKTLEVPENSTKNTLVGTVPAADEDTWSVLTYRLADVDPTDEVARLFNIESIDNIGYITVAEDYTLDHETRDQYKIWVVVTDNGAIHSPEFENLSDSALITINVTDVNEPPEFIDDGKTGYTVAENSPVTTTEIARYEIKDVDAADANFGSSLTVSIKDNNGQHTILANSLFGFTVETTSAGTFAVIRVIESPDFEAIKEQNQDTVFTVTLTLKDIAGDSAVLVKNIYVSDVNEKPTVEDAEFAVDENSKMGDSVGVVKASDPDKFNPDFGTLYYSLLDATAGSTPGADTLFNIDDSGKITVAENAILNYEADSVYYVKVRVTDKELSDTATVIVKLNDVEENPKIIVDDGPDGTDDSDSLCVAYCTTTDRGHNEDSTLTVKVYENSSNGTTVFAYVVSDEDAGDVDNLTASLRDDNGTGVNELFDAEVKKVDGKWKVVVSVLDSSKLDYETIDSLHQVTVFVTDQTGKQDSIIRIIKVIDVNEAPTIEDFNKTIEENLADSAVVGELVAADPDVLNPAFSTLSYEIVGDTNVPFLLDSNVIKVKDASKLNYETDSLFTFKVRVTDGTYSDTASVTVKLSNVDEFPKIVVDDGPDGIDDTEDKCIANCDTTNRGVDPTGTKTLTVGIDENKPTSTVVFEYVVADEDIGEVTKLVPTLEDNKGSGADSLFTVALDTTGSKPKIVVSVKDGDKLNYELINPKHEVSIIVTDPNGLADTLVRVIEVIDINEPPTFESWPFEFTEHNEAGTIVGHIEHGVDVDTTAISGISIPANYENDWFTLTGGLDGADTLFSLDKDGYLIANKTFNFETDPTEYVIFISLVDSLMPDLVETDTIHITLKDKNEDPWIETETVTVDEHVKKGTVVDTIEAKDLDLYDTVLTFTLVEDTSGCFKVSERGVITVKESNCKALDYEENKELPIKVKVTDSEGVSDTKTIKVKINDVNEPPHIDDDVFHISEDAKVGSVVDTVTASDPDVEKEFKELTYSIVEGDTSVFKIDPKTGEVVLKDSLDYEKQPEYTLVVVVDDGQYTDTAKVTIKVDNVFEQPEVEITRAENTDTSWTKPDTIYTNKKTLCIEWEARIEQTGKVLTDSSECGIKLKEGENLIIRKFEDPTMDEPGVDTLVVYLSTTTPVVSIRKADDDASATSIFTVVQQSAESDTSFYVNDPKNEIIVTVKDPVDGTKEEFTTKIELDTLSVPTKTFTNTMAGIADFSLALNDDPASGTTRTPVNGEKIAVSYTEKVDGHDVVVTYYTDNDGELIENADGVVEMTVTYTKEINGHEVKISYQADAVTGALIKTSGGYAKPEDESEIASSSSGKSDGKSSSSKGGKSSSSGKDGKSSSSKGGKDAVENEVVLTVSYDMVDESGNIMTISYGVDAEGNIVRNEDGNIGYLVSYTYTNKYGNSAIQSLFIVLDQVPPSVKILYPTEGEVIYSNYVDVKWTVDIGDGKGPIVQDTLVTQSLNKGGNIIVREYRDKAGNIANDTVRVIMKNAKDVDIAVEQPVTEVTTDKVAEYYATSEPREGQTFAVTIYNSKTGKEVETIIGGEFDNKKGSGDEPYPGLDGHLGPTLGIDTKIPTVNAVGGLATLDDIINKEGLVVLSEADANDAIKMPVEEYVDKFCDDEFAENMGSDFSRANLYKTKMFVKIWIYTTLGSFVDFYTFTQELDDPDYANKAGLLTLYFEMKPDRDGNVRTQTGRLMATGAYVYKTEVEMRSTLRCSVPPFDQKTMEPKPSNKVGTSRSVTEDMLKSFGYKRPNKK